MRINIIYEVNNREYNNCLLLQREMLRRGHDARIYNKTEDIILRDNTNSVTIIPNSYRNEDLDHYRFCFYTNCGPIIIYPCEQVTNHKLPAFFDYSDKNEVKKLPHLCWSQDYYDFLKNTGFSMDHSKVVGAIQLDYCRPEFADFYVARELLAEKYHLPIDKKWVLFISDFVLDNDEKYNRLIASGDVEKDVLAKRRNHERKSTKKILEWFNAFFSGHSDYILIYRKHPVEILSDTIIQFQKRNPERVYCISEYGIKDWIMNCDRIMTWNSTAAVECYAAGKNIHLLRPYEFDIDSGSLEYEFYKDIGRITNYSEFENKIVADSYPYTDKTIAAINHLYSIESAPAFLRVADAIEEISEGFKQNVRIRGFNYARIKYLTKNLIVIKILIKKVLQVAYIKFGINLGNQSEKGVAINEWMATADNKKDTARRSRILDSIISKYNS